VGGGCAEEDMVWLKTKQQKINVLIKVNIITQQARFSVYWQELYLHFSQETLSSLFTDKVKSKAL
jgi:hypothetical protein